MEGGLEAKIHEGGKLVASFFLFLGLCPVLRILFLGVLDHWSAYLVGGLDALLLDGGLHEKMEGTKVTRGCAAPRLGWSRIAVTFRRQLSRSAYRTELSGMDCHPSQAIQSS